MTAFLLSLGILTALSLGFVLFTRRVWFFRDPDHSQTPQNDMTLRSPVYGRIAYIRKIEAGYVESNKKGERIQISDITKDDWPADATDGWLIGIAMTALDVHYQYAPMNAKVGSIRHLAHGRNLPMFDLWEYIRITWLRRAVQLFAKRYTFENERQTMWLENSRVKLALVLIADKFVAKITTFASTGAMVPAGGKLSFIGRGSQVDVVICGHSDLEIAVAEGQAVYGPLTALAKLPALPIDGPQSEPTSSLEALTV